jgi:hypothetical protein
VCRNDGVRLTAAARVLCSRSCRVKSASWVGVRMCSCSGHGCERDVNVRGHGGARGGGALHARDCVCMPALCRAVTVGGHQRDIACWWCPNGLGDVSSREPRMRAPGEVTRRLEGRADRPRRKQGNRAGLGCAHRRRAGGRGRGLARRCGSLRVAVVAKRGRCRGLIDEEGGRVTWLRGDEDSTGLLVLRDGAGTVLVLYIIRQLHLRRLPSFLKAHAGEPGPRSPTSSTTAAPGSSIACMRRGEPSASVIQKKRSPLEKGASDL